MRTKNTWFKTFLFSIVLLSAVFLLPQYAPALNSVNLQAGKTSNLKYLEYVYTFLQRYYVDEVDPDTLYKGAMEGMLNALEDPYTSYISNDSLAGMGLQDTTKGSFAGIGVLITKSAVTSPGKPAYVEVTSPIEGTPGWAAGLQSGDFITHIDGTPTADITQEEVLQILRGPVGTDVKLKVLRGKNMEFELTITRAKIEIPTVKYAKIKNDIGYIRLIEFNPNTQPRTSEAVNLLQQEGCKKIILDLRNNPGGLITSAVDVASIFLDSGVVVSTKSRIPVHNIIYNVQPAVTKIPQDIPLIVLINKGSASASEIVAGALKDYKRAYLIGQTSFGKGLVQQIMPLNEKESFKFTVARYYSPSDANINKSGILPDLVVETPSFNEEEEKILVKLFEAALIPDFVRAKKDLSKEDMQKFAKKLYSEYPIRIDLLMRLIKLEYNKKHGPPIFDLEYDEQLRAAVKLFETEDVTSLCETVKTVLQMQEEAKLKEETKTASGNK